MNDDRNDGQQEQDMNQATGYMECRPAKDPQNQKNHE
jgi:hypothetical protein